MTKKEAVNIFIETFAESIAELKIKKDKVALRTSWNDFTDMLCKDGQITDRQYNNWVGLFQK